MTVTFWQTINGQCFTDFASFSLFVWNFVHRKKENEMLKHHNEIPPEHGDISCGLNSQIKWHSFAMILRNRNDSVTMFRFRTNFNGNNRQKWHN